MKFDDVTTDLATEAYKAAGICPIPCYINYPKLNGGCLIGALLRYAGQEDAHRLLDKTGVMDACRLLFPEETYPENGIGLSFGFDAGLLGQEDDGKFGLVADGYQIGLAIRAKVQSGELMSPKGWNNEPRMPV